MPRGSSSIIVQSLKIVHDEKNSNNNKCMFIIDILSLWKKNPKKTAVTKNYTTPGR